MAFHTHNNQVTTIYYVTHDVLYHDTGRSTVLDTNLQCMIVPVDLHYHASAPVRGQRKPQLQLLRRIVVMIPSNYAWRVVVSVHSSKESERFSSVEAVCGHA